MSGEVILVALKLKTAALIEPLTLAQVKLHCKIDSGLLSENLTTVQVIAPGSHIIAAAYSLVGTGVDVLGYRVLVNLNAGTNGAGGTVTAKIQESDDGITYTDWTGGAFTVVTVANDNAVQEKEYTGTKQYVRVVATVAGAACEFGADVIKEQPYSAEDDLLTALITVAREYCEGYQNRQYITATWELWLDDWPCGDRIKIPLPPLQAVNSITYYDTDNVAATMAAADYFVDDKSEPGRVVLAYGMTWPTTNLRPANGVCIEFDAGYGGAVADVPKKVTQSMLLLLGHWNENREAVRAAMARGEMLPVPLGVQAFLSLDRVVPV